MNIGIVTDFYYPWIGGPSTVIRNIGHGLAARGHSVSVLAPSPTGEARIEYDGALVVTRARTLPVPFGYQLRAAARPKRDVEDWLRATQPHVLNVHHPFPLSASAVWAGRRRRIPVTATNHTIPDCSLWGLRNAPRLHAAASWAFGSWIVQLLNRCSAVATPTNTAARALRAIGYSGPLRAISNGIDTTRFQPSPRRESLRIALGLDDRPIVLYTGRLDAEKEMDVWLRAARATRERVEAQFVIGGNGSERSRLEALVQTLGLQRDVHFTGYLSEEEFPSIYSLADVYCITSRVELQSISTLEALASGLPVVGVNAGALPELVKEGVNGHLADPGSHLQVATGIVNVLTGDSSRARMSEQSRKIALDHALEASVTGYENFLASAAAGTSA